MNSIESEIAIKKLLLLGRLIKEPKISSAMKSMFNSRTKRFFDSDIISLGVLPGIAEAEHKHELFLYWYQEFLCPVEPLYFSDEKSIIVEK